MSKQVKKTEIFERSFSVQNREIDENARTVEIAFSSEEPYERYFGMEVLSHNPESVRLDRLMGGAAVLVNHDPDHQVGVVESARIDSDKRGRAVLRFSKSQRGQEVFQDVQDGIRQLVSVGYRIHKYETEERAGQPDMVTVTDWEPYELSLVAIPADASVGVGRSAKPTTSHQKETPMEPKEKESAVTAAQGPAPAEQKSFDVDAERKKVRTEETKRTEFIRSMASEHDLDELGRQGIAEGWTPAQFNEKALAEVGKRNSQARSESRHSGELDLSRKDRQQFSLVRLMDAIANPNDRAAQKLAGFELEVSAESQRGFGGDFKCRGEFVPTSLLGRALDTTVTDGGELIATNLLASEYIEVLRNASAVTRAGMTLLPGLNGNVAIPRQTSGAASTWISAEDGDATEGEAQFDQVTLSPKDLACYTEVTRRLLQQSTPAIEGIVRRDLALAQALGIDAAALYGTGANGQPTGVSLQTGINTLDLAAADPTYAEIISMITAVMADNALTGNPMWLIEAQGWDALSKTSRQASGVEGNFILGDNNLIKGYPYILSNQVADEDYFFGDWSQVLCGEWGGLEINVDPYTHSLKGKIRYVTFKTVDIAVRQPTAFCWANDAQ